MAVFPSSHPPVSMSSFAGQRDRRSIRVFCMRLSRPKRSRRRRRVRWQTPRRRAAAEAQAAAQKAAADAQADSRRRPRSNRPKWPSRPRPPRMPRRPPGRGQAGGSRRAAAESAAQAAPRRARMPRKGGYRSQAGGGRQSRCRGEGRGEAKPAADAKAAKAAAETKAAADELRKEIGGGGACLRRGGESAQGIAIVAQPSQQDSKCVDQAAFGAVGVDCPGRGDAGARRRSHEREGDPMQWGRGGPPVDRERGISRLAIAGSAGSGAVSTVILHSVQTR